LPALMLIQGVPGSKITVFHSEVLFDAIDANEQFGTSRPMLWCSTA
jgi:hypothetical protein